MLVPALVPYGSQAEQKHLGETQSKIFKTRYLAQVRPFAAAHDMLWRAHNTGRKVVLASSASAEELEHYLGLLDARDIVSVTTSADDVKNTKAAPDIFAAALEKIAPIRASEAIVVGDTPYDVEAARRCEMAAIGLRSGGFSDAALLNESAVALYDDVAALLEGYDESPLAG